MLALQEVTQTMATVKSDFSAKFQTNTDADIEATQFTSGEEVTVVQTWDNFFLIKDNDGHFYNVAKENIQP